ncbi:MAG: glycerophosphodiester phosphodiesterase family protein, partial [Rubrivivax sp.]|nr:glycerophosphodiester phosphodiesterase family protein [Rubrivivax sp.]
DAGAWHSPAFAGEPPATLQAVAGYLRANGLLLNLEIKPTPGAEAATGSAVAQATAKLWFGAEVPPLLSSFRADALLAAQAAEPMLPRALLLDRLWDGWQDMARTLQCVAVVTDHALMDASLHRWLRRAGMRSLCYTVNEPDDARRLLALGIDGLITDALDRFPPAR